MKEVNGIFSKGHKSKHSNICLLLGFQTPKPKGAFYINPFLVLEAFFYGPKSAQFFLKEFFLDAEIQLMHIVTYCTNFL